MTASTLLGIGALVLMVAWTALIVWNTWQWRARHPARDPA